jgi:DNA polymerase-3 subunit alpha
VTPRFVHVRVHTEYSLVDGLIRVPALLRAVRDAGMPAVAVTDQGNLFALVKFYQAAMAAGVKPVVGVDLRVAGVGEQAHRLTLLCQDAVGYRNLTRLVSRSYLEGQAHGLATVQPAWLEEAAEGLIAISGGPEGAIGQALLAGRVEDAHRLLAHWRRHFPDRLYLEVLRTGREREEEYREAVVDLAVREGVPLVATNDVRFLAADDFEAHEARVCIQDGRTLDDPHRPRRYSPQQYLKCPAEMHALFADLPDALENTVEIARRCNLELSLGKTTLPAFPVPPDEDEAEFFARQAREGLARRLATVLPPAGDPARAERQPVYEARLEEELGVIQRMGFAGYFLIVADFIRWARDNGIPVGPGRGSGAGSLVAYALGITDLDPLAYDLLFERFLNPERVSMPDFDIDFCMEGRDRVIEYVADRYGRDRVSQIITHGSMAAKAVVRDVGRVLGYAYGFVDRIAKLIPFDPKMTLDKAIEDEEELRRRYEQEDEVRGLIDLARKLEGLARNAGRHAGGVVIAPSPLTDFTPLYCEEGATGVVTQLDKDDVEAMGLVKFDFLGLRTLTIIDWAVAIVNRAPPADGEPPLDIGRIPVDDRETFELVKRAATTAVFQLESHGMKNLIRRLQPDCFEDVIALVALFRPGPLQSGMVDDFIARKHGRARVEYPHPDLVPILKPTYGVILYQEQVMQIARVLAGYTLGGADLLRRAMGKKKPEEMAKQREVFLQGATARGVSGDAAAHIFDLMEKFAGYGFNKSHSAAYALVAYQTAWLKAHHPAAFMAATLSADMDKTDKVVGLIEECRQTGLSVLPPDVNRCEHRFTVEGSRTIRYGLGAIKGVGEGAVAALVAERAAHGPYRDLADFCRRVELRKLNRRMLEAMIRAGAFDGLGLNRASLMGSLTAVLQFAARAGEASAAGQPDLFGALGPPGAADATPPSLVTPLPDWPDEQRLAGEKETLGLYLTGHPIERYRAELAGFVTGTLADLAPAQGGTVVVAGLVTELRTINSRRGRMAVLTLDDRTARIGVVVYTELYTQRREVLAGDRVLVVEGELTVDDRTGGPSVVAQQVHDLDQARAVHARRLLIRIDATQAGHGFVSGLATVLKPFQEGRTPVYIEYRRPDASAELRLGDAWRVNPTEELLRRLGELAGSDRVRVEY